MQIVIRREISWCTEKQEKDANMLFVLAKFFECGRLCLISHSQINTLRFNNYK